MEMVAETRRDEGVRVPRAVVVEAEVEGGGLPVQMSSRQRISMACSDGSVLRVRQYADRVDCKVGVESTVCEFREPGR